MGKKAQLQVDLGGGAKKENCVLMYHTNIKYDDLAIDAIMHGPNTSENLQKHFALLAEVSVVSSDLPG